MSLADFTNTYYKLDSDELKEEFIESRIKQLIDESIKVDKIGIGINGSFSGFIAPTVGVVSNQSAFFSKLVLDDMDIYKNFMNYAGDYLTGEPGAINVIQHFIWNYFGANYGCLEDRMDIYGDGNEYLSVKELKGKNIGACSERSAMAQNLLTFLGVDSELMIGKLNGNTLHAYIVFKSGNGQTRILYDPMNPVVYTVDGEENYCPGVCLVSEEDYNKLKTGEVFNFNYDLAKKVFIRNGICREDERTYTCDDIEYAKSDDSLNIKK